MITENVSSLQIHKLSQAQYNAALAAGTLNENALYLTPDADGTAIPTKVSDLENDSGYATQTYVDEALSSSSVSLLDAYPVGSVYISYVSTSPASLFGGTWTAITGVFPYFNAGTATGGSNTHTLTVAQIPAHTHDILYYQTSGGSKVGSIGSESMKASSTFPSITGSTESAGSGGSHNNMPAYQTFYAWRRTA